jgi:hypothetical protein
MYQRDLTFDGFNSAIDSLAETFYDDTYDDLHPFEYVSNKPTRAKRVLLYKLMRLGDNKYHSQVRQSFGGAFANSSIGNKDSRIPRDDPGQHY